MARFTSLRFVPLAGLMGGSKGFSDPEVILL